jgi:hypothetical protein
LESRPAAILSRPPLLTVLVGCSNLFAALLGAPIVVVDIVATTVLRRAALHWQSGRLVCEKSLSFKYPYRITGVFAIPDRYGMVGIELLVRFGRWMRRQFCAIPPQRPDRGDDDK